MTRRANWDNLLGDWFHEARDMNMIDEFVFVAMFWACVWFLLGFTTAVLLI